MAVNKPLRAHCRASSVPPPIPSTDNRVADLLLFSQKYFSAGDGCLLVIVKSDKLEFADQASQVLID
ncbi:MAG: hypothetical protein KUL88_22610 [Rhizobium sp.]|nr:hypothetical protein [Rhizobium sp.]